LKKGVKMNYFDLGENDEIHEHKVALLLLAPPATESGATGGGGITALFPPRATREPGESNGRIPSAVERGTEEKNPHHPHGGAERGGGSSEASGSGAGRVVPHERRNCRGGVVLIAATVGS
jgi:hypothetical protein